MATPSPSLCSKHTVFEAGVAMKLRSSTKKSIQAAAAADIAATAPPLTTATPAKLILSKVKEREVSDMMGIRFAAFADANNPLHELEFPLCGTARGKKSAAKRMIDILRGSETTRTMKITDPDSGQMIAAAEWNIYAKAFKPELYDNAEIKISCHRRRDDNEYATHVVRIIDILIAKKIKGSRCCFLDNIYTLPAYQGRGAASKLLDWGIKIADKLGVPTYLVAVCQDGMKLYESRGFVAIDIGEVPVPTKWKRRQKIKYMFMERPAPRRKRREEKRTEGLRRSERKLRTTKGGRVKK